MATKKSTNKVQPLKDKILVKAFPPEEVSEGGIIVPDSVKERPSKAWVKAVGELVTNINEGDVVFHVKGAGIEIEVDKEQLFLMPDRDVLAILN
jgi:chaperonin GroES